MGVCLAYEFTKMAEDNTGQQENDQETMVQIVTSVPRPIWKESKEIAQKDGLRFAEFIRICVILGLNAYAEGNNKRLVNQGLREK